jgi:hypothetical protein
MTELKEVIIYTRIKLFLERVNIQNKNGEAKDYQIGQFLTIVERYNLKMEKTEEKP